MIKSLTVTMLLLVSVLQLTSADIYMHNPRGSNCRLNEASAERNNGNRLFDSQNNNRGGYNVGVKTDNTFAAGNPIPGFSDTQPAGDTFNLNTNSAASQYGLVYLEQSELSIEWTHQHGCGGNEQTDPNYQNCMVIIQYMCDTKYDAGSNLNNRNDLSMRVYLRDGTNTDRIEAADANNPAGIAARVANNGGFEGLANQRGRHENEYYYFECQNRNRNPALFLADQQLQGNKAQYTRQNANGNRRGLECPEERDYYPYWAPSPWRDIAILTDSPNHCDTHYKDKSQNNNLIYKCYDVNFDRDRIAPITQAACVAAGGQWRGYTHGIPAPDCRLADWTRQNHLGNARNGYPVMYNWTLPSISSLDNSGVRIFSGGAFGIRQYAKCVVRVRYNISTDDYDAWNISSALNNNPAQGIRSPVTNNPVVDIGARYQGLRLAINTNQFGRTFQDRSHIFYILQRPSQVNGLKVFNLNVRGKRGNIVQTFPSVEYDFVPQVLIVRPNQVVHFQWTGSNTHNNGNPGGDGQTGDAGEGTGGTDRNNVVFAQDAADNYPIPYDINTEANRKADIFKAVTCLDLNGNTISKLHCQLALATSGYYRSTSEIPGRELDVLLNNAGASFTQGILMRFSQLPNSEDYGEYHFFCTRNNSFTNRSQKGVIRFVRP